VSREFTVGFVAGADTWKTLEIQNASQRLVKLVVVPEQARDFGDRWFVGGSPQKELASWKARLETAKQVKKDL
jgi:hypothetical protein